MTTDWYQPSTSVTYYYIPVWPGDGSSETTLSGKDVQLGTFSSASVTLPGHFSGYAESAWLHKYSQGESTPLPGEGAEVWTWCEQIYDFTARGQGEVTVDVSIPLNMDVVTSALGEQAGGRIHVAVVLYGGRNAGRWETVFDETLEHWLTDGDDYSYADRWTFSLSSPLELAPGDVGHLYIWSDSQAFANCVAPVPLPGAALLGVFGLGYAGFKLRREQ